MKIQIVTTLIKYAAYFALLVAAALLSSIVIGAQTKRPAKSNKPFSAPCAEALRIGLDKVEELYARDQQRRYGNQTDSGTEGEAQQNAQRKYIACRRADNAVRMKNLTAFEKTQINLMTEELLRLARMRVDLIYGVSFDERSKDPINVAVTHAAIALVENYKGNLIAVYKQRSDPNFVAETKAAERDEKQIGELLARIEKLSAETDDAAEFAAFKRAIDRTLKEIEDVAGTEKVVTTAAIVRLLKMNLPDEK